MPGKHAVLSASSAERWLHCPGSVQLTKDMPDTDTAYTREGTLAHSIGELKLRKQFGIGGPMGPRTYTTRLNKLKKDPLYQPEMDRCTDDYRDYIVDTANALPGRPYITVEHKVDYSSFAQGGFGTADCIMYYGSDLFVNDYKHGAGVPVEAKENPQMMLYALGAVLEYQLFCDFKTIHLAIIQPRAGGVKEWSLSRDDLMDWAAFTVRPAADKATEPDCSEYHSGPWCRWCKAANICRTHAMDVTNAVADFMLALPPLLSPEEFGGLLHKLDPLLRYAEKAKACAVESLLKGESIPGWKLVEGRKTRAWDNQEAAFEALSKAGIEDALLWHREPFTLAQIEKQLGAKAFAEAAGNHVIQKPGKPTLAPEEDKRESYSPRPSVEEDFKQTI